MVANNPTKILGILSRVDSKHPCNTSTRVYCSSCGGINQSSKWYRLQQHQYLRLHIYCCNHRQRLPRGRITVLGRRDDLLRVSSGEISPTENQVATEVSIDTFPVGTPTTELELLLRSGFLDFRLRRIIYQVNIYIYTCIYIYITEKLVPAVHFFTTNKRSPYFPVPRARAGGKIFPQATGLIDLFGNGMRQQ